MRKLAGIFFVSLLACGGSEQAGPPSSDGGAGDARDVSFVDGLSIDGVALFQAVKVPLVEGGVRVEEPAAPVIADRPGLLRVYVKTRRGWTSRKVQAELRLFAEDNELAVKTSVRTVKKSSIDADPDTCFDFRLDAEQLPAGVSYSIAVREVSNEGEDDVLHYPGDGATDPIDARTETPWLKVRLVPLNYSGDGEPRLPDTSDEQLTLYRQALLKWYPIGGTLLTVRSPMEWTQRLSPSGSGWGDVLEALVELRVREGAPRDVFYMGAFEPNASIDEFCARGCVLGLAPLVSSASERELQVGLIAGFPGETSATSLAHELGHQMGREHAPCGGADVEDPNFPYPNGAIGVPGYDIVTNELIPGNVGYRDFMGYCSPPWVSDYTYNALFARLRAVSSRRDEHGTPRSYRLVTVNEEGALRAGPTITRTGTPTGEKHAVTYFGADGKALGKADAFFYPFDHVAGGQLFVPVGPGGAKTFAVEGIGSGSL